MQIKVTEKEIDAQIELCADTQYFSIYPSMSYEDGVRAALEWVLSGVGAPMEQTDV